MTSPSSPNPLIAQFRAAGRLINEWRDTLSYGALGAATAAGWISLDHALIASSLRETHRAMGWLLSKTPIHVGSKPRVSNARLGNAANVVVFLTIVGNLLWSGDVVSVALSGGVAAIGATPLVLSGGPKAVLAAYREVMWDYPRKKDDGGMTQTQKLKDGGKELLQELVDQVTPAPTPVPVPVRMRSHGPLPRPRR